MRLLTRAVLSRCAMGPTNRTQLSSGTNNRTELTIYVHHVRCEAMPILLATHRCEKSGVCEGGGEDGYGSREGAN